MTHDDNYEGILAFLMTEAARPANRMLVSVELLASPLGGGTGKSLGMWSRQENDQIFNGNVALEEMTVQILEKAENHAETSGAGEQKFDLRTKQAMGGRIFHTFRVESRSSIDDLIVVNEPPNAQGVLGQQMRHTEFLTRMQMQTYQMTLGTLTDQIARLREECEGLRRERNAALTRAEQVNQEQDLRDYQMKLGMNADERKTELLQKTLQVLPVIASRFLGPGAGGEKASSLSLLLSTLANSITPEQLGMLRGMLTMEQQMLLGEAIRAASKIEETAKQGKPPNGSPGTGSNSGSSAGSTNGAGSPAT